MTHPYFSCNPTLLARTLVRWKASDTSSLWILRDSCSWQRTKISGSLGLKMSQIWIDAHVPIFYYEIIWNSTPWNSQVWGGLQFFRAQMQPRQRLGATATLCSCIIMTSATHAGSSALRHSLNFEIALAPVKTFWRHSLIFTSCMRCSIGSRCHNLLDAAPALFRWPALFCAGSDAVWEVRSSSPR